MRTLPAASAAPSIIPSMASAPIPSPPELLRELLSEDRADGLSFDQAWSEELEYVLHHTSQRSSWRRILEDTRDQWRECWDNLPGPLEGLSLDLADDAREVARAVLPA